MLLLLLCALLLPLLLFLSNVMALHRKPLAIFVFHKQNIPKLNFKILVKATQTLG